MKMVWRLMLASVLLLVGCETMKCKKAPAPEKKTDAKVEKAEKAKAAKAEKAEKAKVKKAEKAEKAKAKKAERAKAAKPEVKKAEKATLEMKAVDSSTIDKVGYDAEAKTLVIKFDNGETYKYLNVPEQTYKKLMKASSAGKFFNDYIKDKFETKKCD